MQVAKRIPFEDPQVLLAVRIAYVVSNLLIFGLNYYISTKIKQKKGKLESIPSDRVKRCWRLRGRPGWDGASRPLTGMGALLQPAY